MVETHATYDWLMDGAEVTFCDRFDAHVLASVLALAIAETETAGLLLSESTGLTVAAFTDVMRAVFPHALALLEHASGWHELAVAEDERSLQELLMRFSTLRTPLQLHLAALIARRAMRPNHLWQDLGLRNRGELSALMRRHFEPLAGRNVNDMKWKKFLYRMICRDEGFRLCTAPSCAECDDFAVCFGDESGESLLAWNRRQSDLVSAGMPAHSLPMRPYEMRQMPI
jgi:nitrogen fixation protein NifQ